MAAKERSLNIIKEITFKAPWGVIQAKAWGPDDGIPFLGLHGFMDNANTFDKLAPLLPENIRFVALDFPGHGKSSHRWPGMAYIYFEYVADIKKVVTQLGWEKFSIIGHSMGANIGAQYASAFPNEIENLVLVDFRSYMGSGRGLHIPEEVLANYATGVARPNKGGGRVYPTIESAIEKRRSVPYSIHEEGVRILLERGAEVTKHGVTFSHDPRLRITSPQLVLPFCTFTSMFSEINCAVLVLESKESSSALPSHYKELLEEMIDVICRHAKFSVKREVPGGHHTHLEYPERNAQEITEFLKVSESSTQKLTCGSKL